MPESPPTWTKNQYKKVLESRLSLIFRGPTAICCAEDCIEYGHVLQQWRDFIGNDKVCDVIDFELKGLCR